MKAQIRASGRSLRRSSFISGEEVQINFPALMRLARHEQADTCIRSLGPVSAWAIFGSIMSCIRNICEASAIFCSSLEQKTLESERLDNGAQNQQGLLCTPNFHPERM